MEASVADSKVVRATEFGILGDDHTVGLNKSASVLSSRAEQGGDLNRISANSDLARCIGRVELGFDPLSMIQGIINCGVEPNEAARYLSNYCLAYGSSAVESEQDVVSVVSSRSSRSIRKENFERRMSVLPDERGFCYLHVVRWARRPHLKTALGSCPSMRDFVALLRPDDLDMAATRRINVFRLYEDSPNQIRVQYHLSENCVEGVKVGSFYSFLACMLRLYPHVNGLDFGLDDSTLSVVPLVGTVGMTPSKGKEMVSEPVHSVVAFEQQRYVTSPFGELVPESSLPDVVGFQQLHRDGCVPIVTGELAQKVNDVVPVERTNDGFGFSAYHLGVQITVEVARCESGQRLLLPVPSEGYQLWLFQPDTVECAGSWEENDVVPVDTLSPYGVFKDGSLATGSTLMNVVGDTTCLRVSFTTGSRDDQYFWRSLISSGLMSNLAVDWESKARKYFFANKGVIMSLAEIHMRGVSGILRCLAPSGVSGQVSDAGLSAIGDSVPDTEFSLGESTNLIRAPTVEEDAHLRYFRDLIWQTTQHFRMPSKNVFQFRADNISVTVTVLTLRPGHLAVEPSDYGSKLWMFEPGAIRLQSCRTQAATSMTPWAVYSSTSLGASFEILRNSFGIGFEFGSDYSGVCLHSLWRDGLYHMVGTANDPLGRERLQMDYDPITSTGIRHLVDVAAHLCHGVVRCVRS